MNAPEEILGTCWAKLVALQKVCGNNRFIKEDPVNIVRQCLRSRQMEETVVNRLALVFVQTLIEQGYIFTNKLVNGRPIDAFKIVGIAKPDGLFISTLEKKLKEKQGDIKQPPLVTEKEENVLELPKTSEVKTSSSNNNGTPVATKTAPVLDKTVAVWIDLPNYVISCKRADIRPPIKGLLEKVRELGKIVVANAYHNLHYEQNLLLQFQNSGFRLITVIDQKDREINNSDEVDEVMKEDLIEGAELAEVHVIVSFDKCFRRLAGRLKSRGKDIYRVYVDHHQKIVAIDDFPAVDNMLPSFYNTIPSNPSR